MTKKTVEENQRLVVEIMGPAGAGKTTLLRALSERRSQIQPGIPLSKRRLSPFLLSNSLRLLLISVRYYRRGRWFNRRETRSMVYLKAWLHVLGRRAPERDVVTIFDHGPIYRLALLREFGPEIVNSPPYARWWTSLLRQWTEALDVIIWLDAPNGVLLQRIRARDRWHAVKESREPEADEFLNQHRMALERLIGKPGHDGQITLLRFDSSEESMEQIAESVLATIDSTRGARG